MNAAHNKTTTTKVYNDIIAYTFLSYALAVSLALVSYLDTAQLVYVKLAWCRRVQCVRVCECVYRTTSTASDFSFEQKAVWSQIIQRTEQYTTINVYINIIERRSKTIIAYYVKWGSNSNHTWIMNGENNQIKRHSNKRWHTHTQIKANAKCYRSKFGVF